jgi:hypothetical protein
MALDPTRIASAGLSPDLREPGADLVPLQPGDGFHVLGIPGGTPAADRALMRARCERYFINAGRDAPHPVSRSLLVALPDFGDLPKTRDGCGPTAPEWAGDPLEVEGIKIASTRPMRLDVAALTQKQRAGLFAARDKHRLVIREVVPKGLAEG